MAACIVLQGVGAVFALREAERQVVRGRLASDIHQGFFSCRPPSSAFGRG